MPPRYHQRLKLGRLHAARPSTEPYAGASHSHRRPPSSPGRWPRAAASAAADAATSAAHVSAAAAATPHAATQRRLRGSAAGGAGAVATRRVFGRAAMRESAGT